MTCDKCGKLATVRWKVLSSRWCEACYQPTPREFNFSNVKGPLPQFETYYDHVLGEVCTSYRDQEKKVAEYNRRMRDIPETEYVHGPREVSFFNDNHKFVKECLRMSKNKPEYVYERYKANNKDPKMLTAEHRRWFGLDKKRIYFTAVAALMLMCTFAYAERLSGVDWVELTVGNKIHSVPMYHPNFKQDIYNIKRAIEHDDQVAREILLGGSDKRVIFIGDGETIKWLYITEKTQWVEEL